MFVHFRLTFLELEVKEGVVGVACKSECRENYKYRGNDSGYTKTDLFTYNSFAKQLLCFGNHGGASDNAKNKEEYVRCKLTAYAKACKGVVVIAENAVYGNNKMRHILKLEYHPAKVHYYHSDDYAGKLYIELGIALRLKYEFFYHKEQEEVKSPDKIIPGSAVPEACERPNYKEV